MVYLVFVYDEVFAQHGQGNGGTRLAQVVGRALEKGFIGQHGQAGCAAGFVIAGMVGGAEIGAYQSFGWAGLFDFGDDGGLVLRMFGAKGGNEVARRGSGFRLCFDFGKWDGGLLCADFSGFGGEDFLQDVGHGVLWLNENDTGRRVAECTDGTKETTQ